MRGRFIAGSTAGRYTYNETGSSIIFVYCDRNSITQGTVLIVLPLRPVPTLLISWAMASHSGMHSGLRRSDLDSESGIVRTDSS